ncbi:IS481 family transposase [Ilyomonas limi]|jgi:transposase InsO family protein|uniref:IS481 family transposase n=1 Tax=Ilyomonas limi TaxID=2575867 RepID=A0A4U3KYH4_9BACT|nr:IS481 family transposase [Ilyomonas limi]TKK66177.1 IS481 family transposase [Ilyomonas limi]
MNDGKRQIKARETWVKCFEELGSVSKAARKCGIPRSTLYRWIKRCNTEGKDCLKGRSKRPKKLAKQKINDDLEQLIQSIRSTYNFGPQRIHIHLLRVHHIDLSSATIWRVLKKHHTPAIKKYRKHSDYTRYSRPVPGDRVQLDVTKVGAKCYQFTAVDDCTRLRALKLYPNKKAESTVDFLGYVLDVFQFPVQRVQTDWGTEFFNDLFQYELAEHFIKFRPIKPRSPHLNGKVERSQLSDKAEFYSTIPYKERNLELAPRLLEWQHFYNHKRPHASLNGKTPYERYLELEQLIPIQPKVTAKYWEKEVEIIPRNSRWYYRK